MIHVAICTAHADKETLLTQELLLFTQHRGIELSTFIMHDPSELRTRPFHNYHPDILIISKDYASYSFLSIYHYLQKIFPSLVTILLDQELTAESVYGNWNYPVISCTELSKKELRRVFHNSLGMLQDTGSTLVYYKRPQYVSTPLSNILYFSSEARKIHMISTDHEETFYYKMNDLEEYLQGKKISFVRIHQSYLVNAAYIQKYDRNTILLRNGEILKISNIQRYRHLLDVMNHRNFSQAVCVS